MSGTLSLANPNAFLQYNGVRFGTTAQAFEPGSSTPHNYSLSHADFKVSSVNKYNASATALESIKFEIQCRAYLTGDEFSREKGLADIREALSLPRGTLVCFGMGVNANGRYNEIPEISWGPHPTAFEVQPIGSLGAIINWTIEFEISPCPNNNKETQTFRSFSYSSTFSNDSDGFTARTISGSFSVFHAQAVVSNKESFQDNPPSSANTTFADQMRESVVIPVPFGYRRERNEWRMSADKLMCNFTVVDTQLRGGGFQPGISKATGVYSFKNAVDTGEEGKGGIPNFAKTVHTLQATLTAAPGNNPGITGIHFFNMLRDKIRLIRDDIKKNPYDDDIQGKDVAIIPIGLQVQNGLYEAARTTSFTASFLVTAANKNYLYAAMWQPLPDTDYDKWQQSMEASNVNRAYGSSGLSEDPDFDSVTTSLCDGRSSVHVREGVSPLFADSPPITSLWECGTLDDRYSWIEYDPKIEFIQKITTTRHKAAYGLLPNITLNTNGYTPSTIGTRLEHDTSTKSQRENIKELFPGTPDSVDVTEVSGLPNVYLKLTFRGARFNKQPSVPAIQTYDGVQVTLLQENTMASDQVAWGGCVIYGVSSVKYYRVEGDILNISKFMDNPLVPQSEQTGVTP